MPATVTDSSSANKGGHRYQKLRRGVRGAGGLTRAEVVAHQRARLCEATIEMTAAVGYEAMTIKAVCALAGVSRRTFYDLFGAAGPVSSVATSASNAIVGPGLDIAGSAPNGAVAGPSLNIAGPIPRAAVPSPKEACFLSAYDFAVGRAASRINQAYRGERDPELRLCRAFERFARVLLDEPQTARVALVEVLGAGPAALARMRRTRAAFERMIGASLAEGPDGVALPAPLLEGIVCGIERITRRLLLAGGGGLAGANRLAGGGGQTGASEPIEAAELAGANELTGANGLIGGGGLAALSDELLAWVLSYRAPAAVTLAAAARSLVRPPAPAPTPARWQPRTRVENDRARILCCAARIAAARGYAQLSPARIAREAEVSEQRFAELFESTEQCFLDALDRLGLEALVCVARAARGSDDPVVGVHRGIVALMRHIADDPVLVRVAFVEVFALGPRGVRRRERLLGQFTDLLARSLASRGATRSRSGMRPGASGALLDKSGDAGPRSGESRARPDLALEASVGAIWGIVHQQVTRGAAKRLPELAGYAGYLALAPAIGGEAAVEVIRDAGGV